MHDLSLAVVTAASFLCAPLCGAQTPGIRSSARDSIAAANGPLFSTRDAKRIAITGAGIALLATQDRAIQRSFQKHSFQTASAIRGALRNAGVLGDPGAIVFPAVTYFAGIAAHSRPVASLGMYSGEAVVLGGLVSESLKGIGGRARPKVDSANARSFSFGKGFSQDDYGSFPSAETTIVFAAATEASRYVSREWPGNSRVVTPIAFGAATLVAISRLYNNEHWASDVAAGAAIGTFSAIEMDRWNQAHPNNVWERIFLPKGVSVSPRSAAVSWSIQAGGQ